MNKGMLLRMFFTEVVRNVDINVKRAAYEEGVATS
jgi:hypothetical protein